MIPALILTHNCLELTTKCLESLERQSFVTRPYIVDNGSTDETPIWLMQSKYEGVLFPDNKGVSYGWNKGLENLFTRTDSDYVLVVNNDTVLPWFFVEQLIDVCMSKKVGFVTGLSVDKIVEIAHKRDPYPLVPHPDFSAFMISRSCWNNLGMFDFEMVNYCSDCDYHVRAHKAGIPMWKAHVPFYHKRSSTMNMASPEERQQIAARADADREAFRKKWGCIPGEPEYAQLFS